MQNKKLKPFSRFCIACLCFIILITNSHISFATDSISELEQSTDNQRTELANLRTELLALTQETEALSTKITETQEVAKETELHLAAAKLSQESQYEQMKKRIRYMYENGSISLLELICSAENMTDFINATSFVFSITEYDRIQLEELQALHDKIALQSQELAKQQEELATMQETLVDKRSTLATKIETTESSLALTQSQLAQARVAATPPPPVASTPTQNTTEDNNTTTNNNTDSDNSSTGSITQQPPMQTDVSEIALFAGILECEAGTTDYNALLAVATVILNRVGAGGYYKNYNTVRDVIYQRGQFPPATNGKLDRILARGPGSLCFTVAQDALNGARYAPVSHCFSFRAASSGHSGINVGNNVFF